MTNDDWSRRSNGCTHEILCPVLYPHQYPSNSGTAKQISVDDGVSPMRGQTDVPTDLLGAAKLTGQVGDMRYGVLSAIEDDVEWMGETSDGSEVKIVGPGRDLLLQLI